MPTLPSTSGTKSRTDRVAVSYRRRLTGEGYLGAASTLTTSAVAMAATPSPRPVRPSPSVVVADTETGAPTAADRAASASDRRGATLGRLPTTCTDTLPITKPAARTNRAVSTSRSAPDAPDQRGSSVPKTDPRSPRPAAASNASQAACAATSPSLCPPQPTGSSRKCRPARCIGRPASSGWTSTPVPTRGSSGTGPRSAGEHGLGEQEVQGPGHLEGLLRAGYDDDAPARGLDVPRVVGRVGRRVGVGRVEDDPAEALGRLHGPQRRPVDRRHDRTGGVDLLDRVGDRQAGYD